MRYLIIVLSGLLTACVTTDKPNDIQTQNNSLPEDAISSIEQGDEGTPLSRYLRLYLAKNISNRAHTSRNLIDRSGIEGSARLPSKSLFQSLGYRVRDPFIAMPPELNTRNFNDVENTLHSQLIQSLEITWALLDTTRARLKSQGGLEQNRQDWEVPIVRRNLLLEAIGYWYQMRNQENHSQWLIRLSDKTNELFDEISLASQQYDVSDLRDQELVLLDLRTDIATLFQFFSSEQARLYNRIGERVLPEGDDRHEPYFERRLECSLSTDVSQKGTSYLTKNYPLKINAIDAGTSKKSSVYELGDLARILAKRALKLHGLRLNKVEQSFLNDKARAQEKRQFEIDQLVQKQKELHEINEVFDSNALDALKNAPLQVYREQSTASNEEQQLYNAITELSNRVSKEITHLNLQRLNTLLLEQGKLYSDDKTTNLSGTTNEMKTIRELMLGVYDYVLLDYLVGYERISFINQAMLSSCQIDSKINSRSIGFEPKSIDGLAELVERYYSNNLKRTILFERLQARSKLSDAFSTQELGENN